MFKQMQFFTFCLLLCNLLSCNDQVPDDPNTPPELPPLTMEGKNTLGCKINGKNWVASVGVNLSGLYQLRIGYDSITGHLGINSYWRSMDKKIYERLGFESYVGDTILGSKSIFCNPNFSNFDDFDNNSIAYRINCSVHNEIQIIYHDPFKKIVSGRFEFVLINSLVQDTIKVTEGRFDGHYE